MFHINFTIVKFAVILCVMASLCSCRTAGFYTSNPKGNAVTFAGNTFHLTKSDSFFIRKWSDSYSIRSDKEGNRIFEDIQYQGYGTYRCVGDSLELTVANEDSIMVVLDIERHDDTISITVERFNELGNAIFPHVDILDDIGDKIVGTPIAHRKNTIRFDIVKDMNPSQIKLSGWVVNVADPIIDFSELENGRHAFKKKSYNGYFAKGVKKIWFKKVFTGIRYQMHDRKSYLPKKFGWSWINKLYRDY